MRPIILILTVLISLYPFTIIHGQNDSAKQNYWSKAQKELWEQEQDYWKLRKEADFEGFMNLWDERFIGWSGPGIISRSDIQVLVKKEFNNRNDKLNYELKPLDVKIIDDIGVTFYYTVFMDDEGKKLGQSRFHHTWKKQDGTWKIISGMSASSQNKN